MIRLSTEPGAPPLSIVMVTRQYVDISYGGVEVHILNLARQYTAMGMKVKVIRIGTRESTSFVEENFPFRFVNFGRSHGQNKARSTLKGNLGELFDRILMNFYSVKEYKSLLSEIGDAQVVHFHDLIAISRIARRLAKSRNVIWTNHLGEFLRISRLPLGPIFLKMITKPFCIAFAPSKELGNQNCISSPVYEIPNGFDVDKFTFFQNKDAAKEKLGISVDKKVFLVPRRWAPNKGIAILAEALKGIEDNDSVFVFLGSEAAGYRKYNESIITMLEDWKIEFRLIDSVPADEMPDWYHASDFTFIPSLEEAISLAALEAMGSGSLVLCTPVGGLLELITDGQNGLMSEEVFAPNLRELFSRANSLPEHVYHNLISAARSHAEMNYTWNIIASQMLSAMKAHSLV